MLHTTRDVSAVMMSLIHLVVGDTNEAVPLLGVTSSPKGREGRAWGRLWGADGLDNRPEPSTEKEKAARAEERRDLCALLGIAERERREACDLAEKFCEALARTEWREEKDGYGWSWAHEWARPGVYRTSVMFEGRIVFQSGPETGSWVYPLGSGPEYVPYPADDND